MAGRSFEKDPDEDLDYGFNLTDWLTGTEKVVGATFTVTPDGIVSLHDAMHTDTEAAVWVRGGTPGQSVTVTGQVTTDNVPPRIFERSVIIHVKER